MRITTRYLLGEHLLPFLFGMGVILFVLLTNFVVRTLDRLLSRGTPLTSILEVFVLSLGWMAAMAVPMAVLVATLMAFGRLAGDQEILALRAAGVSPAAIARPVFLAAAVMTCLMVAYNEWVLPETNHRLANRFFEIYRRQPTLELEEGVFYNQFPGYSILADRVNHDTQELRGVTLYEFLPEGEIQVIRAARGRTEWSPDATLLTLHLEDGEIHRTAPADASAYRRATFGALTMQLRRDDAGGPAVERRSRGDREMGIRMILAEIAEVDRQLAQRRRRTADLAAAELARLARPQPAAQVPPGVAKPLTRAQGGATALDRHRQLLRGVRAEANAQASQRQRRARLEVELHKKFAIPAACLIFVLVGAPLGIRTHRGGLGIAVGISFIFFVVHYIFLVGGENLADRGKLPPLVAMWGGDALVGAFGLWAFWRTSSDLPLWPATRRRPAA